MYCRRLPIGHGMLCSPQVKNATWKNCLSNQSEIYRRQPSEADWIKNRWLAQGCACFAEIFWPAHLLHHLPVPVLHLWSGEVMTYGETAQCLHPYQFFGRMCSIVFHWDCLFKLYLLWRLHTQFSGLPSSGSGGRGPCPPPQPHKSHKKDGWRRRPINFMFLALLTRLPEHTPDILQQPEHSYVMSAYLLFILDFTAGEESVRIFCLRHD